MTEMIEETAPRGKGAPKTAPETKRTKRIAIRLSDAEKKNLLEFATKNNIKMSRVYREAINSYLASDEPPPEELHNPGQYGKMTNFILISLNISEKTAFDNYMSRHNMIAASVVRHALERYISANTPHSGA